MVLNSTAGVLLEDICRGCFKGRPSEKTAYLIVKGSILVLGALSMVFLFVVEKLGGILEVSRIFDCNFKKFNYIQLILLQVATSLSAIAAGTTFGVFTLGMLIPWSNNTGAIVGAIAGAIMSGWISFGTQAAVAAGTVVAHKLDISIAGCDMSHVNSSSIINPIYHDESNVFPLYRLSFHWINPIGILSVLIAGSIASYLAGPRDLKKIDPELISPVIHRFLPIECFQNYDFKINGSTESVPETFTLKITDQVNRHEPTTVSFWFLHFSISLF